VGVGDHDDMELMSKLKGTDMNEFGAGAAEFDGESNVEIKDVNWGLLAIIV
jgi:hypothetical protein